MAMTDMGRATVFLITLAAGPHDALAQEHSGFLDTVWVADACVAGRPLRVEVILADTVIYRTSFTICRRERSQILRTHWPFSFTPSKRVIWSNDSTDRKSTRLTPVTSASRMPSSA